jgi:SAM-dependent methyltransferase
MAFSSIRDIVQILWTVRFSPATIIDLMRLSRYSEGVCGARTVAAGVGLGLFDALSDGPKPLEALTPHLKLAPDRVRALVDSGVYYSLLGYRGGLVRMTRLGRRMVAREDVFSTATAAWCFDNARGGNLLAQMRNDPKLRQGFYQRMEIEDPEAVRCYGHYMAVTADAPARTLAKTWDLSGVRRLLDVGGGIGRVASILTERHRGLDVTVVDLPEVRVSAEAAIEAMGGEQVRFEPRDFRHEALPTGHDAVLFSRVLHDWDRETVVGLLVRAREALPSGGRIAIFEVMRSVDIGNPQPVIVAQWEVMRGSPGEIRTVDQYRTLLTDAGFRDIAVAKPFDPVGWNSLVTAVRG